MRLINCSTLQLEEFFGHNVPRYAILSHTWGDDEVSFADFSFGQPRTRSGYRKIEFTCEQAICDGFNYAWVDTCCIDKSSSAELSEAINSMFTWYENAALCYAYLSDVDKNNMDDEFPKSRWFTRGWTLQELLAPTSVFFYDRHWLPLGSKGEHAKWISDITKIEEKVLLFREGSTTSVGLGSYCVAKRMSWASTRETTRVEDIAYCLLGIFQINMPLLYGEGGRAFLRLQEEIIRKTDDDSILAWGLRPGVVHFPAYESDSEAWRWRMNPLCPILARSPKDFENCADLYYAARSAPFTLTNVGLQIQLPLVPVSTPISGHTARGYYQEWVGLLSCSTGSRLEYLGIVLQSETENDESGTRVHRIETPDARARYSTVVVDPRTAARSLLRNVTIVTGSDTMRRSYHNRGHRQIIMGDWKALEHIGYRVKSGTAWNGALSGTAWNGALSGEPWSDYNSVWDPGAMAVTIRGRENTNDMIEFCFESLSKGRQSEFTVFIRTINNRAIVREGNDFHEAERRYFYKLLGQQLLQDDEVKVVIRDSRNLSWYVSVEVHETSVHDHRLFEVNLDAEMCLRQI